MVYRMHTTVEHCSEDTQSVQAHDNIRKALESGSYSNKVKEWKQRILMSIDNQGMSNGGIEKETKGLARGVL